MTSVETDDYERYPPYCNHLSPTISRWCPLRASDIQALKQYPGFEGQDDVFFRLNHPIRWVRIAGVVVAIDNYHGRRIYIVDDSTGTCIECALSIPIPKVSGDVGTSGVDQADPYPEIDVGMVVEVRGSVKLFRDQKQIKVQKLQKLLSTNQEVQFWNKISAFRDEVLSHPWVLDGKVVRKLKREQEADQRKDKRMEKEDKRKIPKEKTLAPVPIGQRPRPSRSVEDNKAKKAYRPSQLSKVTTHAEGAYDALGL